MASIGIDSNGRKRVLFVAGDGSRKTIRLGKASMKQAERFKDYVEALIGAGITSARLDDDASGCMSALAVGGLTFSGGFLRRKWAVADGALVGTRAFPVALSSSVLAQVGRTHL